MGGGSSKTSKKKNVKNPVDQNWQVVENGQNFKVVRNKTDGRQAQQHSYTLDNRYDPCGESHIYERRSKTTLPIVRSFQHQWQAKGKGLVPKNQFRVVTERVPHRLTTCPQLSFDQTLYVLDRSLQGFNFLYRNVGPFDVNSNMIGFTHQGEAKVWLNENFGQNYPYHEKRTLQSTRNDETHRYDTDYVPLEQIELVRNIVNVVQDRCQQGQFPEPFRSQVRQNLGFEQVRKIISQQWDSQDRVRLNRVDLYKNLIKSKITKTQGFNTTTSYVQPTTATSYVQPATSYVQPSRTQWVQPTTTTSFVQPVNYTSASTYQTNYAPSNDFTKNAFSFSYQKPVVA